MDIVRFRAFVSASKTRAWRMLTRAQARAGFTLIELLATVGIMTLITGMILANYNTFGGNVLLQNLAYDIALTIRQAQVFGISVKRSGATGFNAGYGVHFDMASPGTFVIFADASEDGMYDPGELVNAITIRSGYHLQQLCVRTGAVEDCANTTSLDILFKRPEPDAWISRNGTACITAGGTCYEWAKIVAASPNGATMSVQVYANGQISIQQSISL